METCWASRIRWLPLVRPPHDSLNDRIEKTKAKKEELLKMLEYSVLPLHNNNAEQAARAEKRRQDVSLQTKTEEGTKAKDTFLTITQTAYDFRKGKAVCSRKFVHSPAF
ncbi:MAG: transposase [Pseudomonadota bacterium]